MEDADVVICGAGPSGLVLGLLLAAYKVKSIILEKQWTVEEDPRGIVMSGDALRLIYSMGLGEDLAAVSQEKCMRARVQLSGYCELRVGCELVERKEDLNGVLVRYQEKSPAEGAVKDEGSLQQIRARWLVGADGKKGIVRKKFLEPVGITQQVGSYEYTGTWIAANLQITLPTPDTHPDLPVWKLGISPQDVYDIFWPTNWHFCTHPAGSTAAGRFGPPGDRLWRHEFAIDEWTSSMDARELLWKHLIPMITRNSYTVPGLDRDMTFPQDCIKILRCRPFTFVQKIATPHWYHNRTLIIGDAAHVFPPFGGQGIASGIRDAVGLGWRLATLLKSSSATEPATKDLLFSSWNLERLEGVEQAVEVTMVNGKLTNQKNRFITYCQAALGLFLISIPPLLHFVSSMVFRDDRGYKNVKKGGFFLHHHGGGGKVSQIYMQSNKRDQPFRSDDILSRSAPIFTVLAVVDGDCAPIVEQLSLIIAKADLDDMVVSRDSIYCLDLEGNGEGEHEMLTPCSLTDLSRHRVAPFPGYNEKSYMARLGVSTRFALIRPDTIIFAL